MFSCRLERASRSQTLIATPFSCASTSTPRPVRAQAESRPIFTVRKVWHSHPRFIIMWRAAHHPRIAASGGAVSLFCGERQFLLFWWNADFSRMQRKRDTHRALFIGKISPRKLPTESVRGRRLPARDRRESRRPEPFRCNRLSIKPECAIRISPVPNARPEEARRASPQSTRNRRRAHPIRIPRRRRHRKRKSQRDIPRTATTTKARNRKRISRRQRNRRADGLADFKLGANARRGRSRVLAWRQS